MKLEFENTNPTSDHPSERRLTIEYYGGTMEECIAAARQRFKLNEDWELVRSERE